jgi:hypothetical protein
MPTKRKGLNRTPKKKRKGARRRSPRSAGEWKPVFLATLAESGIVRDCCRLAGVARSVAYETRDRDPEFAAAWADALEDACDGLAATARARALESSDTLLIFLLKSHKPEVYGDRFRHEHSGADGRPLPTWEELAAAVAKHAQALDNGREGAASRP